MRRLVLICMMLLLPVQWTWAAAAAYCAHETGVAAKHMGHHEHKHQDQADAGKPSPDSKLTVPGGLDSDCHFCHLGSVQWLAPTLVAAPPMTTAPPRFEYIEPTSSHIPSGPERPDRSLAA